MTVNDLDLKQETSYAAYEFFLKYLLLIDFSLILHYSKNEKANP